MEKHHWKPETKILNIYKNMEKQIEKVFRHTRKGSYCTRARYEDGVKHFGKFLADAFKKQNLNKIQGKHLEAYTEQMMEAGYSKSYITTNLSATRYFVDHLTKGDSSKLPTNEELGVGGRSQEERIGPDRSWTETEFNMFKLYAIEHGNQRIAEMIQVARDHGLRIHEVAKIDKAQLGRALKTGELTVKGKGGLIRQVPVRNREHLQKLHKNTAVGQKVFVNSTEKTHLVIQNIKNYITNHRPDTSFEQVNLTFHGLRHTFARNRYLELREQGFSKNGAKQQLSKELGHFRPEITDIYLGGANK